MQISEIKQKLSLSRVLEIYLIKVTKNNMALCPFHNDTKPSLQVNLSQNYYKCHACGKQGDQIQFVQDFEKLSKHEALLKCATLINEIPFFETIIPTVQITKSMNNEARIPFLEKIYETFIKSVYLSAPAKDYLKQRNIHQLLEKRGKVGFNSGQFHHAGRFENESNPEESKKQIIAQGLEYGLLIDANLTAKTGEKAYQVFGNKSLVFALRNEFNEVVSLYFRSIDNTKTGLHFYLKNRQGLYPNYPAQATKKLILTESIIDCASLLGAIANSPFGGWGALACFGTNGLTAEHLNCIKHLPFLEEIIFFFDGDSPGQKAVLKYAHEIPNHKTSIQPKRQKPLVISQVQTPDNEDINSLIMGHDYEIITHLIESRITINPFSSTENTTEINEKEVVKSDINEPTTFLKQTNLLARLNTIIGKSGIVGEENSRLLLFLIIISYINKSPIHAIIQGSSGSGKTLIISRIADLMPQEDVLRFTRITESSLYNWGEFDLFRKIIIIEDLDGLKEEALYALRELISNQFLSSSVSIKDKKGNNKSARKEVKGQFSSLAATTKGETYEDNMSRSFLIAVDESKEQTKRIIAYQNQKSAGEIDPKEREKAVAFIQSLVRNLKYYEVINPFATKLQLPEKVHKIRRLNEMYQAVIKQVTFLNQYQRQQTSERKLITTIEDIEQATEILFESIVLKVDELDGSLRQFFERLKKFVKDDNQEFILREIRQELHMSKTQIFRFMQTLLELEYIKQIGGYSNKGIKYKISYWDNYQKLRTEIKDFLMLQIEALKKIQ
jgi:DNA primase